MPSPSLSVVIIAFNEERRGEYNVSFVAVSTQNWDTVGVVRLEILFTVVDNTAPAAHVSQRGGDVARSQAHAAATKAFELYERYDRGRLEHS